MRKRKMKLKLTKLNKDNKWIKTMRKNTKE